MVPLASTYMSPICTQSMLRHTICLDKVYSSHQMDPGTYLDKIQHHTFVIFSTTNNPYIHIQLYIFQSSTYCCFSTMGIAPHAVKGTKSD